MWLNEVSGIDTSQRHMIGVKRYNDSTIWVRDNDEGVKQLIKDRDRMLDEARKLNNSYSEYLREQKHGKK